jgi:hypothetical protein
MIRRLATSGALIAAVALAIAGCGSGGTNNTPTTPDPLADPAVAWAENVCKAQSSQSLANLAPPVIDPNNPAKARDTYVDLLTTISKNLGAMTDGIKNAGPAPVPNGQQTVDTAVAALVAGRQTLDTQIGRLKAAKITDTASLGAIQLSVNQELEKGGFSKDPVAAMRENKQLDDAFDKAPTCKKLESPSAAPTS